jgi:histidinol-phosphate aminotransferase
MPKLEVLPCRSRRNFLQFSAGAAAAATLGLRIVTEPLLARAAAPSPLPHSPMPDDAVLIDANENPLGRCQAAREALAAIVPQGGRYSFWMSMDLEKAFADSVSLKPEYVKVYPGSSEPLQFSVLAFTCPTRSYVTADPGYEVDMTDAKASGARVVKTALTKTFAHDVKAMLAATPDAGLFYICTPNNPTGTLTSHSDIEYLLENKPNGAILLIDEAYLHFADLKATAIDLVKTDKDIVVLRTFSKIYGMAGLRCGFAIARPDLLEKIGGFSG